MHRRRNGRDDRGEDGLGTNRIDQSSEFEQHFIRGLARMRTRAGVALAVMMALALGHLRAGRPEAMRSLFAMVPFADTG